MKLLQFLLLNIILICSAQANPLLTTTNIFKNIVAAYAIPKLVDVAHESAHYVTGYAVGAEPQKMTISPLFDENYVSFNSKKIEQLEENAPYKAALIYAMGPIIGITATYLFGKYFSNGVNLYTFLNKKENLGVCMGMCLALSRQGFSILPQKHQMDDGRVYRSDGQQFLDALNKHKNKKIDNKL